ncbi:cyanophycinase [Kyrpidia spormannii]|uniref:Cyanophycinase n=2 Tax=Kyrpidia spormannii TaxID=2055160 RepID=A0ACA8Z5T7_9BACL|nr:cyanophycinase [Kyrpidia spormannii]CAB3389239.1 Cyanophycinase [Kyrpidia spormannii]CAB3389740.1 Cyanophycinase [Kyrpidia spormannii]
MRPTPGPLVIIGGAEDKQRDCVILRELVRLAGGEQARIVVITSATEFPIEVGNEYVQVLTRLGAEEVHPLHIVKREDANAPFAVRLVERASCVFFTGGEQGRITRLLGGTQLDAALHRRHGDGLVLAGTSAGASVMSSTMIVEGEAETSPRPGIVHMEPGMEFLNGVVIDQHFAQRGRLGRLLSAVTKYPHHLGMGIDENTAVVVSGAECRVIGSGAVSIVDASALTYANVEFADRGEPLALCGIRLHVLPAGHRFDLRDRRPILEDAEPHRGDEELTS